MWQHGPWLFPLSLGGFALGFWGTSVASRKLSNGLPTLHLAWTGLNKIGMAVMAARLFLMRGV